MSKDSIGDRMKMYYENVYRTYLTRRTPVIIRLDGNAFHTFTSKFCKKSFDAHFIKTMHSVASKCMIRIQGAKIAYVQSDEISILLTDYDTIKTDAWFGYNVQKITSISAAMATAYFNKIFFDSTDFKDKEINEALFDSRCFNIPIDEVMNYFIWRQRDWQRNSLSMYARQFFSQKQLHKKNSSEIHEMLHVIGKNWTTELNASERDGTFIYRTGDTVNNLETICSKISYDNEILNKIFKINN